MTRSYSDEMSLVSTRVYTRTQVIRFRVRWTVAAFAGAIFTASVIITRLLLA